jgi:hypothetical protein
VRGEKEKVEVVHRAPVLHSWRRASQSLDLILAVEDLRPDLSSVAHPQRTSDYSLDGTSIHDPGDSRRSSFLPLHLKNQHGVSVCRRVSRTFIPLRRRHGINHADGKKSRPECGRGFSHIFLTKSCTTGPSHYFKKSIVFVYACVTPPCSSCYMFFPFGL